MEIDARSPKCKSCFDAVCREPKLLEGGDWRIGADAQYHWRQLYSNVGVCGEPVMTDTGRPIYGI